MTRPRLRNRADRPWRLLPCARRAALLLVLAGMSLSGCALVASSGDRHFAERDFARARDEYLLVLENRQAGRRVERALYHLGLIYLQPDPELHDPIAAEEMLTRLTYIRPRSRYAAKAALVLELRGQTNQLHAELAAQRARSQAAEERLAALALTATETEARSENQSRRADQLGSRVAALQAQIVELREELAATGDELTRREEELERLKRIDLEEPR